jgi:hypothetical protein
VTGGRFAAGRSLERTILSLQGSPLGPPGRYLVQVARLAGWHLTGGTGLTPVLHKQREIIRYGRQYGLQVFIETGSYFGDTLARVARHFRRAYSIELQQAYYDLARGRFAKDPHVEVLLGNSATLLPSLLESVKEPCLFWLDARSETDTPFASELEAILGHAIDGHVVLVDDARFLTGTRGYPTIEEIWTTVGTRRPSWRLEVRDDILRLTPTV